MSLTKEQLALRQRGLGASDVPAIIGVPSPGGRTIVDVWARKLRGPSLNIAPIVDDYGPEPETCDAYCPFIKGDRKVAGTVLEDAIAQLYEILTGLETVRDTTRAHPEDPWALATADRLVLPAAGAEPDRGLEIKLVGERQAARAWPEDGVAEHVWVQTQWCMYVYELARWDVCALVGGSAPRIVRIERDDAFLDECVALCRTFWFEHVLGNSAPPPPTAEAAMALARTLWGRDDGTEAEAPPEALALAEELVLVQSRQKELEEREKTLKAGLAVLTAERKRIFGPWGAFQHATKQGSVSWKAVAIELAGGVVPHAVIEKHRGAASRTATLYPHKRWAARLLAARNAPQLPEAAEAEET